MDDRGWPESPSTWNGTRDPTLASHTEALLGGRGERSPVNKALVHRIRWWGKKHQSTQSGEAMLTRLKNTQQMSPAQAL